MPTEMAFSPDTLLENVHRELLSSSGNANQNQVYACQGNYAYFHYCCDGVDDRGWGCGYRTLQTICSWLLKRGHQSVKAGVTDVPSILQIQNALVAVEDKPKSFHGSKQWIGSFEVYLALDYFYGVPCKIIHLTKGIEMADHMGELAEHFQVIGSPIMMGGETDNSSKGVVGVCMETQALLIVDPHYSDNVTDPRVLRDSGFIKWLPISQLHTTSFYNLCLPKPSL